MVHPSSFDSHSHQSSAKTLKGWRFEAILLLLVALGGLAVLLLEHYGLVRLPAEYTVGLLSRSGWG